MSGTPSRAATGSPGGPSSAAIMLGKQFKQMQTDKDIPGISCGLINNNIFQWEIMLMLSDDQDSLYGGKRIDLPDPTNKRLTIYRRHLQGEDGLSPKLSSIPSHT